MHGQAHQIKERGVTGPEVVKRDADPDLVQAVQRPGRGRGHRDSFGDLEGQPVRLDFEVAERAGDHLLERVVFDVAWGDVQRDADIDALSLPPAQLLQRSVDHPGGERVDDPSLLRHRDEAVGRHQALPRMVPADQRLDHANRAGGERDLGLVVQHELALRDRPAQLAGEAGAP